MTAIAQPAILRTVFLDRDGVINEEPGPILSPEKFLFIPRSIEAVALITQKPWQPLLISNQAILARKQVSPSEFDAICDKMISGLEAGGGKIDDYFYCFHHPDWNNGVPSATPLSCGCRKPQTGLFDQAAKKHGARPESSVYIGDKTVDFEAAFRWNMFSIGVRTGHGGKDGKCEREPNVWVDDLYDAVQWLIRTFPS